MEPVTSSHGLVERLQHGDTEAFTRLLQKYQSRLAVFIHFRLGNQARRDADVDDILQETLLRAYRDIQDFEYQAPGSFFHWLARIAAHVIADVARAQGRQKRAGEHVRFKSESNPDGPEPADTGTPSRIFSENARLRSFIGLLHQLPDEYREAILLAKIEGLSTSELAQRMGRSNEGASLLLHRAIKCLRALHEGKTE